MNSKHQAGPVAAREGGNEQVAQIERATCKRDELEAASQTGVLPWSGVGGTYPWAALRSRLSLLGKGQPACMYRPPHSRVPLTLFICSEIHGRGRPGTFTVSSHSRTGGPDHAKGACSPCHPPSTAFAVESLSPVSAGGGRWAEPCVAIFGETAASSLLTIGRKL